MKTAIALSLLIFSLGAQALTIDFNHRQGWKFNSLKNDDFISGLLSGASASIVKPADHISSIAVFETAVPKGENLGKNTADWKRVVIAGALDKATVKKEITFRVGKEWRYYIQSDFKEANGAPLSVATMAMVKDGQLVVFNFQTHPDLFKSRIKDVLDLYIHLKVDKN